MTDVRALAQAARIASRELACLDTSRKNEFLIDLAREISSREGEILAANAEDVGAARAAGLDEAKLARLALTPKSLAQLSDGVRQIAALPDPVGAVVKDYEVPSGLRVKRIRSPLGVICMIYEARPGVTIDAFALCFKAGNACLLKGGKEAARSNALLASLARGVLARHKLPEAATTSITGLDREAMRDLLALDEFIDLVIPRGGHELIRFVAQNSRIPTIQHYQGVCHVFVEASADLDLAVRICVNAKTSAPATCNAAECVLVDTRVASAFVPRLVRALGDAGVEVRGDEEVILLSGGGPHVRAATPDDFGREFLSLTLAMRVVDGLDEAIAHIHRYSSGHTEAILTRDQAVADAFCTRVQSSCVLVNASTRFNDGYQLGLGAEIGISTSRLHAFGPMGLEELTIQRFVVRGEGQTR
ncbi:MAG: glutamate-5-semialdehyde dehydrogenase [Planctomycetota bacterium]|nr:glutamate-5-semialdehyde dehydrogenase [Planctomycetota bacterium]